MMSADRRYDVGNTSCPKGVGSVAQTARHKAMIDPSQRQLMTKLGVALILLVAIGAAFSANRVVNLTTGLLLVAVGAYMIALKLRLRKNGST
jgi:hypothetical protein